MSEIFREVDEEVRQERYLRLWKRYGPHATAAIVAVVVATAAIVGWRAYQVSEREAESVQYTAALQLLDAGDATGAANAFGELADSTGSGYGTLARLQQAAALGESSAAAAAELYARIAEDGGIDDIFRDLARLRAAMLLMDSAPPEDLYPRLDALTASDNPWRFVAREMRALVDLRAGKAAEARTAYEELVDDVEAPQGVRRRAAEMVTVLGGDG